MTPTLSIAGWGPKVSVEIAPEAHTQKEDALGTAALVRAVTTPAQQEFAVAALREIKGIKKKIEDSRRAIKAPVLTLGKDIDSAAATFCAELDAEESRITKAVSTYQAEEARKAREAEEAKQAELRRIEHERLAAEREAQRKADEEARAARSLEAAEDAAKRHEAEKLRAAVEAQKAREAVIVKPVVAPARAEGMAVRQVPRFEIIDIRALAFARPDLVRVEPNTMAINNEIKSGNLTITGLRCWMETVAGVRV